jgi:hypothetical protein
MDSRNIKCDCGHPAHFHQSGTCSGYAENPKYLYPDKYHLGGREFSPFCGCTRSHWDVITEYINGLDVAPADLFTERKQKGKWDDDRRKHTQARS